MNQAHVNSRSTSSNHRSGVLDAQSVEVFLDASVNPLGCLFQGKAMLNPLDSPLDGRGGALNATLNGVPEHGDVAFPARRPFDRLAGEALFGAGGHQVERGKAADAGGAHAEDLSPGGGGNANRHVNR